MRARGSHMWSCAHARIYLRDRTSFVCAHLTAHAHKNAYRVQDYHTIVGNLLFPPLPGSQSKASTTMFSTSHLFFFGDLNFRLSLPPTHALAAPDQLSTLVHTLSTDEGRSSLKEFDQLVTERDLKGTIFHSFREGEFWRFKCSYKYKLGEVDLYECVYPPYTSRPQES